MLLKDPALGPAADYSRGGDYAAIILIGVRGDGGVKRFC